MPKQPTFRIGSIRLGLGIATLLLVMLACNLPLGSAPTQTAQPQAVQTSTQPPAAPDASEIPQPAATVLPTSTVLPTATALPSATAQPTSLPPTATTNVLSAQYNGVSLSYDPSLASQVVGKTVPPVTDQNGAPWEIAPQFVQFDFNGYLLSGTLNQPALMIYPVDAYKTANDSVIPIVTDLQDLLKTKPSNRTQALPFLPTWNAAEIFHSNVVYLKFKNGEGVRYLTEFGQSFFPINNHMLIYTFQGLTQDGKYYISLVLPVNNPTLPANEKLSDSDYAALSANFANYINDTQAKLSSQPSSSFKPDLSLLDALVQSLLVQ